MRSKKGKLVQACGSPALERILLLLTSMPIMLSCAALHVTPNHTQHGNLPLLPAAVEDFSCSALKLLQPVLLTQASWFSLV
jgi:hypothetical protein